MYKYTLFTFCGHVDTDCEGKNCSVTVVMNVQEEFGPQSNEIFLSFIYLSLFKTLFQGSICNKHPFINEETDSESEKDKGFSSEPWRI